MTIASSQLPVGYATQGNTVCLHDDNGSDVPPGSVGEIVVRSRFLSPGYWRNDEAYRVAFVGDVNDTGARQYKSGDLGVRGPDGCITHKGRKEFQTKIRGMRIELAEIEIELSEIEGVSDAVVVPRRANPSRELDSEYFLVAHIESDTLRTESTESIRAIIRDPLPEPMVPSFFVFMTKLTQTPNGKIAKGQLPTPMTFDLPGGNTGDGHNIETRDAAFNGWSPLERIIGAIWAELLPVPILDLDAAFLAMGGNSLQAMQFAVRLNAEIGSDVPLQLVFDYSSIRELAAALAARGQA